MTARQVLTTSGQRSIYGSMQIHATVHRVIDGRAQCPGVARAAHVVDVTSVQGLFPFLKTQPCEFCHGTGPLAQVLS